MWVFFVLGQKIVGTYKSLIRFWFLFFSFLLLSSNDKKAARLHWFEWQKRKSKFVLFAGFSVSCRSLESRFATFRFLGGGHCGQKNVTSVKKITNSEKKLTNTTKALLCRGENVKKISRKLLIVGLQLVLALDGSLGPGNFSAGLFG